jgi:hypothetical protein
MECMMLGWLNEAEVDEGLMLLFQMSIAKAHLGVIDGWLCILGLC